MKPPVDGRCLPLRSEADIAASLRRPFREPILTISIAELPLLATGGFATDHVLEPAVVDMPIFVDMVLNKTGRELCRLITRLQMRRLAAPHDDGSQEADVAAVHLAFCRRSAAHLRFVLEGGTEYRYDLRGTLCQSDDAGEQIFSSPWLARYCAHRD